MRGSVRFEPRKRPSQKRSQFTVEQIIEAATQVFSERGYSGGTTNHIADRAGVSIGSLYQYFPNKDAILLELAERHMRASAAIVEEMIKQAIAESWEPDEMAEKFIRETLALHMANPQLQHVLYYEAPRPPHLMKVIHQIEDTMKDAVEKLLIKNMGVQVRHASHAAYIIVHVINGLIHEYCVHPPQDMDEQTFILELKALLRGYLLQPCAEQIPE